MTEGEHRSSVSTPEDRAALFDDILKKIVVRDAFVPIKLERLGVNVREDILRYRDEMITADTDEKLLYAIMKINNARKDPHVRVKMVDDGLQLEGVEVDEEPVRLDRAEIKQAPIRFAVDYGDPSDRFLFVSDYASDMAKYVVGTGMPEIGDRLVAVNGQRFSDYLVCIEPYNRYATVHGFWWKMAAKVSQRTRAYPPHFYDGEGASFTLEKEDGTEYTITIPYLDQGSVVWEGYWKKHGDFRYPQFERLIKTSTYHLYEYTGEESIVLLDWNKFDRNLMENMDALMEYAAENELLGHAVIFDATRAGGGSLGAYAIQRLVSEPFKTTFGNVRISDVVEPFIEKMEKRKKEDKFIAAVDGGEWLMDWLHTDVRQAIEEGREYSNNVPFKSSHLPKDSDGILEPAEFHFEGQLVCLYSPHGGSHLDQFAAMIADNQLAHTIGMPTGGYSNTWEAEETFQFPISEKPVVRLMFSMGHTIRPNGELLEGNPAPVEDFIPLTRDNYLQYDQMLLERALHYLKENEG